MSKNFTPRVVQKTLNDKSVSLLIQNVRCTFVRLDKPTQFGDDGAASYSLAAIIQKKDFPTFAAAIKAQVEAALKISKILTVGDVRLKALKKALTVGEEGALFKDGNKQVNKSGDVYPGLENAYTMKAQMKAVAQEDGTFRPRFDLILKDKMNQRVSAHAIRDEFYSGVWCDLFVTLQPYDYMKKVGITVYLNGVQKISDDERLGGSDPFSARTDIEDDLPLGGVTGGDFDDLTAPTEPKAAKKGRK